MTFDFPDVVRVPFPFNDLAASKPRPALVLSGVESFNSAAGHAVMAMITSSKRQAWPLDCLIEDLDAAGLPAPSLVRFKLFTLDLTLVAGKLDQLSSDDASQVASNLRALLRPCIHPAALDQPKS